MPGCRLLLRQRTRLLSASATSAPTPWEPPTACGSGVTCAPRTPPPPPQAIGALVVDAEPAILARPAHNQQAPLVPSRHNDLLYGDSDSPRGWSAMYSTSAALAQGRIVVRVEHLGVGSNRSPPRTPAIDFLPRPSAPQIMSKYIATDSHALRTWRPCTGLQSRSACASSGPGKPESLQEQRPVLLASSPLFSLLSASLSLVTYACSFS